MLFRDCFPLFLVSFPKHIAVYIDESGDLGFSEKASKVFIIAYVIPYQEWALRIALKRLIKKLRGKKKFSGGELKFSRDSDEVRQTVFKKIIASEKPELKIDIGLVVVEKEAVKKELRGKPRILYNYLAVNYVVDNILAFYSPSSLKFVIDKSMDKGTREAFDEYVFRKALWKANVEYAIPEPKVEVLHMASHEEPCLQLADYIAGATFKKFEHGDSRFYDMFRDRIIFRKSWGNIVW